MKISIPINFVNPEQCIFPDCKYYTNQKDCNGDVVLTHCIHPDNPNKQEGNTTMNLCPLHVEGEAQ